MLLLVTETPATENMARLSSTYRIKWCLSWSALAASAAAAPVSAVAIVDPTMDGNGALAKELRPFLATHPLLPVVAVQEHASDIGLIAPRLLEWGVSELIDAEVDRTPAALHRCVRAATARPLKRRMEGLLGPTSSENARRLVRAACEAVVHGEIRTGFAARLEAHPRTVASWCARERMPAPRRLLAWTRILLGTALLDTGRTVVHTAAALGYANDHAFRRAVSDLSGCKVARQAGPVLFERAAARFREELALARNDSV